MELILFIFLFTLYSSLLVTSVELFLSVFDKNASYLFDSLFILVSLFTFLIYFLLISLLNWKTSKLHCKHSIKRRKYIPKLFFEGIYRCTLCYFSKIVLLNLFDRENDNSQHFNLKNIYKKKMAKSSTVIIFKRGMLINLFLKWQIFLIQCSLILFIIIEVIPKDWYPKNIILSFEDMLQSNLLVKLFEIFLVFKLSNETQCEHINFE